MTITECKVEAELYPNNPALHKYEFEGYSIEYIPPEEIARAIYKLEYKAFCKRRNKILNQED